MNPQVTIDTARVMKSATSFGYSLVLAKTANGGRNIIGAYSLDYVEHGAEIPERSLIQLDQDAAQMLLDTLVAAGLRPSVGAMEGQEVAIVLRETNGFLMDLCNKLADALKK